MVPQLINGGASDDIRGRISFVNDFDFPHVKRFYQINNDGTDVIRAWQGHKLEHKYFFATAGSFVIAWVKIDDWEVPSDTLTAEHVVMSFKSPAVLSIPPGYANGIMALEPEASLVIFSNLSLAESNEDRWSYKNDLWLNWEKLKV